MGNLSKKTQNILILIGVIIFMVFIRIFDEDVFKFELVMLGIVVVCIGVAYLLKDVGVTEYKGKKYSLKKVGLNFESMEKSTNDYYSGHITQEEFRRRDRTGCFSLYAYVELGKSINTWVDEEINKDIFLRHAHDTEKLPFYLVHEVYNEVYKKTGKTVELHNVREYREYRREHPLDE